MSDKTKMSNLESFQELSIKLAIIDAKLDKLIELAVYPKQEYRGFQEHDPEAPYYRSPDSSAKPYGFDIK